MGSSLENESAGLFPIFVRVAGRSVLVVGAGPVAARKVRALRKAGAEVVVVAPDACAELADAAARGQVQWVRSCFRDAADRLHRFRFALAVTAVGRREVNRAVQEWCRRRGVWCNAVDDPDACDFFFPARLQRGALQIAVGTSGRAPGLAAFVRDEIARMLPEDIDCLVADVARRRERLRAEGASPRARAVRLREYVARRWNEALSAPDDTDHEEDATGMTAQT